MNELTGLTGVTLYFLKLTGCEACAEAEPHVRAFAESHPLIEVRTVTLDEEEWPEAAKIGPPDYIPAYVLVVPGARPRTLQGRALKPEEIEKWIAR